MKIKARYLIGVSIVGSLIVIILIDLFPFIWMVSTSLKPVNEIFSKTLELIPKHITFENYGKVLFTTHFPRFFVNSIFVVSTAVIITVVLGSLAAYSFSRYTFLGKGVLLVTVLFSQFFPWIILVTPLYVIFFKLRLINNYLGLIFSYTAISLPFCIFMLIGYFESVPKELDEAARIDGCSDFAAIFKIIMPISWPGLVAVTTYTFVISWNEFLFALTFMTKTERKTVPVGLYSLFGQYGVEWNKIMSISTLGALPAVVVFLFLQKYLVQGLTAGAIKE